MKITHPQHTQHAVFNLLRKYFLLVITYAGTLYHIWSVNVLVHKIPVRSVSHGSVCKIDPTDQITHQVGLLDILIVCMQTQVQKTIVGRGDWVGIAAGLGRYSIRAYCTVGDHRLQKVDDLQVRYRRLYTQVDKADYR